MYLYVIATAQKKACRSSRRLRSSCILSLCLYPYTVSHTSMLLSPFTSSFEVCTPCLSNRALAECNSPLSALWVACTHHQIDTFHVSLSSSTSHAAGSAKSLPNRRRTTLVNSYSSRTDARQPPISSTYSIQPGRSRFLSFKLQGASSDSTSQSSVSSNHILSKSVSVRNLRHGSTNGVH